MSLTQESIQPNAADWIPLSFETGEWLPSAGWSLSKKRPKVVTCAHDWDGIIPDNECSESIQPDEEVFIYEDLRRKAFTYIKRDHALKLLEGWFRST